MNPDEEIPTRSPVAGPPAEAASSQDENDFSTLLELQKYINEEVAKIRSVDVFELKEDKATIKEQLVGYKMALDILEPIQLSLNSTINAVKLKQEGK